MYADKAAALMQQPARTSLFIPGLELHLTPVITFPSASSRQDVQAVPGKKIPDPASRTGIRMPGAGKILSVADHIGGKPGTHELLRCLRLFVPA